MAHKKKFVAQEEREQRVQVNRMKLVNAVWLGRCNKRCLKGHGRCHKDLRKNP